MQDGKGLPDLGRTTKERKKKIWREENIIHCIWKERRGAKQRSRCQKKVKRQ